MASNLASKAATPTAADIDGAGNTDLQHEKTPEAQSTETHEESKPHHSEQHVHGFRMFCIIFGLILAVFCLGLDRTILATAIPKITTDFNSLEDVAWYGSSYLLTTCCFQLMFGKLYAEFSATRVFLAALGFFELGSIICGAAPNSTALIIGRAVAGVGCAGILSGTFIIIAESFPLHKRPIYTGIIGGMAGIAEIIAPTLGGAFTDHIGWRWCFWINLPLGAITAAVVFFYIRLPAKLTTNETTAIRAWLAKLDLLGTFMLMPFMICLLLALQWGGSTYAWNNWRIILCLGVFIVSLLAWLFIQCSQGDSGTLPFRLISQRSVASGMIFMLGLSGSLFLVVYYVSIWFQAVLNTTAQQSGINFLTSSASMSVASILSGGLTSKLGYYVPQMICSSVITSIAAGLMFRFSLETSTVYWAGTLVMFGFGSGMGMQMPLSAVQTVLKGPDIPRGTSVLILAQTLSGAIFLAVGQNLFQNKLLEELASKAPGVDPEMIVANGGSGLKAVVTKQYGSKDATRVLEAYNMALRECFLLCVILCCLTILGALATEWKSVRTDKDQKTTKDTKQGP